MKVVSQPSICQVAMLVLGRVILTRYISNALFIVWAVDMMPPVFEERKKPRDPEK